MSSSPSHDSEWHKLLSEAIKRAHEELGTASVRQVARDLELSHASLVRVRQGDLSAVSRETLLRILDYYGLKPPPELAFSATSGSGVVTRKIAAYCSSVECPTAQVALVNSRWVVRPLTLRVPQLLFEGGNEPTCRECGSRLRHECPECGQRFRKGAFCPWCGAGYVGHGDLREEELSDLRTKWRDYLKLSERVEDY
jgi:hypothetical protein